MRELSFFHFGIHLVGAVRGLEKELELFRLELSFSREDGFYHLASVKSWRMDLTEWSRHGESCLRTGRLGFNTRWDFAGRLFRSNMAIDGLLCSSC